MNANEIISRINGTEILGFDESFSYARECTQLLRDQNTVHTGRKIIINLLKNWSKLDSSTYEIWTDIIEAEGFYPYLEKEKEKFVFNYTAGQLRKEMSKSENLPFYLHDKQLEVKNILDSGRNIIVSAPTSFGKSLLIEELVASAKYTNIVIIQPTLALLDETRKKLKKYDEQYSIIVRTSQEASNDKGNLFLLTAERVMEYHDLPKIDLLIIDEFYKLSAKRDDERSDVLNNAFHLLLKRDNTRFYLLGPNIDAISEGFAEKYNAVFYKTDYSLVEHEINEMYSEDFGSRGQKKTNKEHALCELLLKLKDEQTIIYCSSPRRARYLSNIFLNFFKQYSKQPKQEINLIEWIEENISSSWSLIDCLNYGIAYHDGALQKHISSSVIEYFNDQKINFLFCTSTIIEGVNTSAENIVIFDQHKGNNIDKNLIDYFDYNNIKGRAGRMMVHYIGKVFNFNHPVEKSEETIVDIPFFQQNPIQNEVLIHLDEDEVIDKDTEQYKKLKEIPSIEKELFRKNGVLVDGQQLLLHRLRETIRIDQQLIIWNQYPKYEQLKYIITLAWDYLLKEGETQYPMNKGNLTRITFNYGKNESIMWLVDDILGGLKDEKKWIHENKEVIESSLKKMSKIEKKAYRNTEEFKKYDRTKQYFELSEDALVDEAIRESFNILRHWFQYKVPKWLRTVNTLQQYVCEEQGISQSGNYSFYANKIESDFVRDNLSILLEYGIPKSAIKKIEHAISKDISEHQVIDFMKDKTFIEQLNLLKYEKERIEKSL